MLTRCRLGSIFVLLTLVTAATTGCGFFREEPEGITPDEIGLEYPPEELSEDVLWLQETIEEVHPDAYAFSCEETIRGKFAGIVSGLDQETTRVDLYREVAPAVVALGDGHTSLLAPQEEWAHHLQEDGTFFPYEVDIRGGRIFIGSALIPGADIEPGTEILTIEGMDVQKLTEELLNYVSGERMSFRHRALQRRFSQLLWLIYGFEEEFALDIAPPGDDAVRSVTVPGGTESELESAEGEGEDEPYSFHILPDIDAGLMDFRSFTDPDRFDEFLQEAFARLQEEKVGNLIIDIRENGGGNSSLGDALLKYLADRPFTQFTEVQIKVSEQIKKHYRGWAAIQMMETGSIHSMAGDKKEPHDEHLRFTGEVYLLTSPFTFSSAASFAAAFKHYGVGTLVGEETGGLRVSYGDVYMTYLPNTRLQLGVSHKRFISPGDDDRGITPHHEVIQSHEDRQAGIDPVIQFVRQKIRGENP